MDVATAEEPLVLVLDLRRVTGTVLDRSANVPVVGREEGPVHVPESTLLSSGTTRGTDPTVGPRVLLDLFSF